MCRQTNPKVRARVDFMAPPANSIDHPTMKRSPYPDLATIRKVIDYAARGTLGARGNIY